MKTIAKTKLVCCLAVLALAAFNSNLNAGPKRDGADDPVDHDAGDDSGGHGSDDRPGHHHGEDDELEGHELFHGHIVLSPTADAPANARGSAELEQENEEGSVFYKAEVRASGLDAGTYPVSVVLFSDGSTVTLGDLVTTGMRLTRVDLVLPAGVSVTDIAQVIVSDDSGTQLLVGDASGVVVGTSSSFKSSVRLTPGAEAPAAKGKASISIKQRRGQTSGRFNLAASKLPANTTFNIVVDGAQVGTATSNKHGSLRLRDLAAADLSAVQTVSLVSAADGIEAASANF